MVGTMEIRSVLPVVPTRHPGKKKMAVRPGQEWTEFYLRNLFGATSSFIPCCWREALGKTLPNGLKMAAFYPNSPLACA